ncbi:MAG: glucose-6-phosphate dehydrogenase, partial [bacterium]|nr:glucose-6-phosphate dehydrogenase [bacterium]
MFSGIDRRGPLEATLKIGKDRKKSPCEIDRASDPCAIVIFGASGDLTERKLIPSLFKLYTNGLLPDEFLIVGAGRKDIGDGPYREAMGRAIGLAGSGGTAKDLREKFLKNLYYQQLHYDDPDAYLKLAARLNELEEVGIPGGNRIYYLSTPPEVYTSISDNLGISGMAKEDRGWRRIVVEKPFGRDIDTATRLNERIRSYFTESQIFRIDHYLGKETVQDVLMFRFANAIFEPIWNRTYIDHVQITTAESLGIEKRAGYYEKSGVIRDMFQNHMLQLVALIAMEPPAVFDADSVRDEKVKVLKSIRPVNLEEL